MNYRKIVLTKTTIVIFLAIVLVTGTITSLSSTSFIVGAAQATSDREKDKDDDDDKKSYKKDRDRDEDDEARSEDYGNGNKDYDRKLNGKDNIYESQYSSSYKSNDDYKPKEYSSYGKPYYQSDYKPAYSSYGKKDNNNNDYYYKSTKDSSKSVDIKKINCNNINININNGGQVANNGNTNNGDSIKEDNTKGNKTNNNGFQKFNKNDGFEFVCVNNNDNRQITPTPPPTPPTDNNVYVVWEEGRIGDRDIFFAASNNNGQTFDIPLNISDSNEDSFNPKITSEGNNVYVIWVEDINGNTDIFFTVSTDGGQTFSDPENLSDSDERSEDPQISTEGNNVYVVWWEFTASSSNIFFTVSNDNGNNFSTPDNISGNTVFSARPQISSEGNNVYVVWVGGISGPGTSGILFAESNDNGQTFDTPENISDTPGGSGFAQITSEGNNVYVVWVDFTIFDGDILFAASNDNGETFSSPENLTTSTINSSQPQISAEGNNVYVIWEDRFPSDIQFDIFFAASNDNGQTFSTPLENLSDNDAASAFPQISSEGDNVYAVWHDNTPGRFDIFFKVSNNNGETFSTPPDNLSNTAADSVRPEISSSSTS